MTRKSSSRNRPARPAAKARTPASKPSENKRAPSLGALRDEIDKVDANLVNLLNRRAEIATKIGQLKHDQGLEVWSAAREDEVLAKVLGSSRGPLQPETLRIIYRELIS